MKAVEFGFVETYEKPINRYKKVKGFGLNDFPYSIRNNGSYVWQYSLWSNVITRSKCRKFKERSPWYADVDCCDEWLVMTKFISDIINVENFDKFRTSGWQIDKDILIKGNKVYKMGVVCFVPREINSLLTDSKRARGKYPVGVNFNKRSGKFVAKISINAKRKYLGLFDNPMDAFNAYKDEKESNIKNMAEKYKREISEDVYNALINYQVMYSD